MWSSGALPELNSDFKILAQAMTLVCHPEITRFPALISLSSSWTPTQRSKKGDIFR